MTVLGSNPRRLPAYSAGRGMQPAAQHACAGDQTCVEIVHRQRVSQRDMLVCSAPYVRSLMALHTLPRKSAPWNARQLWLRLLCSEQNAFCLIWRQGSAVDDPDTPMTRRPADEEPFSALAFKIMADKYVGTLTFCRVYRCARIPSCHLSSPRCQNETSWPSRSWRTSTAAPSPYARCTDALAKETCPRGVCLVECLETHFLNIPYDDMGAVCLHVWRSCLEVHDLHAPS